MIGESVSRYNVSGMNPVENAFDKKTKHII